MRRGWYPSANGSGSARRRHGPPVPRPDRGVERDAATSLWRSAWANRDAALRSWRAWRRSVSCWVTGWTISSSLVTRPRPATSSPRPATPSGRVPDTWPCSSVRSRSSPPLSPVSAQPVQARDRRRSQWRCVSAQCSRPSSSSWKSSSASSPAPTSENWSARFSSSVFSSSGSSASRPQFCSERSMRSENGWAADPAAGWATRWPGHCDAPPGPASCDVPRRAEAPLVYAGHPLSPSVAVSSLSQPDQALTERAGEGGEQLRRREAIGLGAGPPEWTRRDQVKRRNAAADTVSSPHWRRSSGPR